MTARQLEGLLTGCPFALTETQLQAIKCVEDAKRHVRSACGKPASIQREAQQGLLDAVAFAEEFDVLFAS
jgi:hypothetical protein